ncbi:uncharacterized protein LOC142329462 [Lycorma delicatula]|uniref:uncharacterized protein LOC142329462 n=1 Tax=Lycorma delicatula TaxID=130591 RepID=UPI003F50D578
MTGDTVLEHRRSEFLNDVRHRSIRMLDKEVQYNSAEIMDCEGADSGLGGSGDLSTVTAIVEINNSPSYNENYSSPYTNTTNTSETNGVEHNNSIIRRDSIEQLHKLQENNDSCDLPDASDCATLPAAYRINSLLECSKTDNDSVDEIKEQSSLVVLNNTISKEKLKELSEKPDDGNCALDCLSFTIQCCDCTIL